MSQEILLEVKNMDKSFFGVQVLNKVNLEVRKGEVHALMGENGAGKSTLIKIITGAYTKDGGKIFWKGQEVEIHSLKDCQALGTLCDSCLNGSPKYIFGTGTKEGEDRAHSL